MILHNILIPTNTPAFQQYALQVTRSNAQMIAQGLGLDQRYMSTNRIACDFWSDVNGVNGWIVFGDRYRFEYESGAFHRFFDNEYSSFASCLPHRRAEAQFPGENEAVVVRWLRMTNLFAGPSGISRALNVASNALVRLALPYSGLRREEPCLFKGAGGPPSFQEFYRVTGTLTPVPLYEFAWRDRAGEVALMEVSGIISNVTLLHLFPPYIVLSRPANYYQMLGLPTNPVFVTPWVKPGCYREIKPATHLLFGH
jgi:hypothetical protein